MSLNSSQEEDEINREISPSSNGYNELFVACQQPCFVVLERLTEDQIQRLTSERPERAQKQIAKNYLRDVPRVDFGLFAQYKRSRQKFIERKKNARERSAEIGDFGFSSSEDTPMPPSDDDYVPEEEFSYSKRKRKAYEDDDDDWNPDGKFSPRPKKTLRNLRVNTRRKRIESNSSSDEFENAFDDKSDAADECFGVKEEGGVASSLIDADLLSNIMREMEDFNQGKAPKSTKRVGGTDLESGFKEFSRSRQKRRISRVIKITDDLTPSIKEVQNIVRNMVNTVCSFEMQKIHAAEKGKKMQATKKRTSAGPLCKWCDIPFVPGNSGEELCKVCKDVVKLSTSKTSSSKKGRKPKTVKSGAINKIKNQMLKKLPKYEQRRLMYGEKVSTPQRLTVGQQDGPEKTFVSADVHPQPPSPSDATISTKKKKLKRSSHLSPPKTKVIKSKRRKIGDPGNSITLKTGNKTLGVDKSVNKDLLRINFPGEETSLGSLSSNRSITTKQPAANNVQYGTYLLPPIPTVVVANYAATDKNGDYYLSSVYYQNEMTQAKNVPGKNQSNIAAPKTNSLPSMPSMDQLSVTLLDQLTSMSSINFTQSSNLSSVPSVSTVCSIETKVVDSMSFVNQKQVSSNESEYNPYSDINLLLNNPSLQIQPVEQKSSNVALNSDIASLFANSQLQIEPIIPSDDDNAMEMDEPLEENNDNNVLASGLENESDDLLPKELENSESASDGTVPPKSVDKSKETKQSLKNKNVESNNTESSKESSEEVVSSEALFRKMSAELDAIGILGVVDLDKNPRFSLERIIETNKVRYEQLQGMKPVTKEIEAKLKQAEDNRVTLQMAKTLLKTFGCFTNLSNSCLRCAKMLQIKQEKQDPDDEEEMRSSCQFAQQSQSSAVPAFVDVMGQQPMDFLANIETQVSTIAPIDPSQYGTVHHFPRSESRETPSRGSGPLTPARPESAISTTSAAAEEPALTPLQIKKERMEASEISPSQCSFATPSPARTPVAQSQPMNPFVTPSPSPHQQNSSFVTPTSNTSSSSNNVYQQSNPPAYPGANSQDTFQILNEMTQRLQNVGQRNSAPMGNQQTHQLSSNQQMQQMNIGNQQNMSSQQMGIGNQPNIMHYQPQGSQAAVPPNVTAPLSSLNNQAVSKVLLNFARRQAPQNTANYIFKNGGQIMNIQQQQNPMFKNAQMVNVQQQQRSNDVMFKNTQLVNVQQQQQQNPPNIVFKNTQMVNVQQVYLPSAQPRLQAGNQGMGQYNLVQNMVSSQGQIVQQGQQQVLMNSAGQQGQQYTFQGGQQVQMPRMNVQQNQVQPSQNQAFMVQNNNRVLLFEIQRPR